VSQKPYKSTEQFVRYVLVGGFNTVFGYALFAFLNWYFTRLGSYGYMCAWAVTSLISLTVAFLGYKWFVFRTQGNYVAEYIRCLGVYGTTMLVSFVGLTILVTALRHWLYKPELAPYIAAGVMTIVTVTISFLGHKNISFKRRDVVKTDSNSETPSA
jgi:putative flippase GtrA